MLRLGWLLAAASGVAATLALGYAGSLGFLVWGAVATPLAWASLSWRAPRGRAASPACLRRAGRWAVALGAATLAVWGGLVAGASRSPTAGAGWLIGALLALLTWALFAAQAAFVLQTTIWMWRRLGLSAAA